MAEISGGLYFFEIYCESIPKLFCALDEFLFVQKIICGDEHAFWSTAKVSL